MGAARGSPGGPGGPGGLLAALSTLGRVKEAAASRAGSCKGLLGWRQWKMNVLGHVREAGTCLGWGMLSLQANGE
eukprot:gene17865-biopygen6832